MPIQRLSSFSSPTAIKTLMGWNQIVQVTESTVAISDDSGNATIQADAVLRVRDYEIGSRQRGDAPDFVTGITDRTAYTKGPVEIEGTFNYPLTLETGTGVVSGFEFFKAGALLAIEPSSSFSINPGSGETIGGCKTNQCSISCRAGEAIECSSSVWGISTSTSNVSNASTHPNGNTIDFRIEGEDGFGPLVTSYGVVDGVNVDGKFQLVQIPMFDACWVIGAPEGMFVVGWSIQIDNALQRNYTMGTHDGASPWGLNASSVSANQRRITGSLTWQSDEAGVLKAILGSGVRKLIIAIQDVGTIVLNNCLWNASPPRIATGDRVTVESQFTALGFEGKFDAISFEDPS